MILCLKTDAPTAEIYLYNDDREIASHLWEAHRTLARDLLAECDQLLDGAALSWRDIRGLVVYRGPGSFTGLRIGCMTANTIAYSETIPIVGATGDDWLTVGLRRLADGDNDTAVIPDYGAPPRITQPKK